MLCAGCPASDDVSDTDDTDDVIAVCTPGADQTCNHDPRVSSLHGHCEDDGTCTCGEGFPKDPGSGRCL